MTAELDLTNRIDSADASIVGSAGGFILKRVGLEVPDAAPTFEQWESFGDFLRHCEGAVHWWIGDWKNYGDRTYGSRASKEIAEATGFDEQTCNNDAWVAGSVEISRRRENLSFAHHEVVAGLQPDDQNRFLTEAEPDKPSGKPRLTRDQLRKRVSDFKAAKGKKAPELTSEELVIPEAVRDKFVVVRSDCLPWFAEQPADCFDLVFGSPPYEDARLYLEDGENPGIALDTREWVKWMVDVYSAALRCCKGLVAFVVEGRTKNYAWTASPALLVAALVDAGITVRKPPIYRRVGIPGSGGPDWLRNDYEFIVCATRGGRLPWSDNTAMGKPCVYEPGGDPTHRRQDGSRVNGNGYASMDDRNNVGPHRARQRNGYVYTPPEIANPGNVVECSVGGGNMGDSLCHDNEAPFPESLAEFFVRSFCPPGGVVCDPFSGSGTTGAVAVRHNRLFAGCDLRESQVALSKRRIARVQPMLPILGD